MGGVIINNNQIVPYTPDTSVNYDTWISLDPGDAIAEADPGGILASTTYSGGEISFDISGTAAANVAHWIFEPKDSRGNVLDAGKFGVAFRVQFPTQPTAGSNISLLFGWTVGTAWADYHGFGAWFDTTAVGPDMVFYWDAGWLAGPATVADADGVLYVFLPPLYWEHGSARFEPTGGYGAWFRDISGDLGFDANKVRASSTNNRDFGTDSSNINLFMALGEGNSAETPVAKVEYKIFPIMDQEGLS